MIWSLIIAKVLTTVMSWADAGNLRNRVFKMAEEAEIMMTALEDIARMSTESRIKQYARNAIDTVKGLPNEDQATAKMGLMSAMGSNSDAPDRQRMAQQAVERLAQER